MRKRDRLKLQKKAAKARLEIYNSLELFPAEYLVCHQPSRVEREAAKAKTKEDAANKTEG